MFPPSDTVCDVLSHAPTVLLFLPWGAPPPARCFVSVQRTCSAHLRGTNSRGFPSAVSVSVPPSSPEGRRPRAEAFPILSATEQCRVPGVCVTGSDEELSVTRTRVLLRATCSFSWPISRCFSFPLVLRISVIRLMNMGFLQFNLCAAWLSWTCPFVSFCQIWEDRNRYFFGCFSSPLSLGPG